ncbi:ABC transporter permease [Dyadobacter psychrotolerans]|uniref:ABC transporter permease n=1 Tax=Dyadobacter psychrotolerans TaxID=2541721 RepID=A0A4R5DAW2_9BACT|nr:ABC transporter permease [Dyadobacter psychrotolerans]TDE10759.1 ABC transporter permease [Dyadobacter psychrotolerans]
MKNFLQLLQREIRLFFSNPVMPTLYIGGPVLFGLLFGFIYVDGKLNNLPVVVVDLDNSPASNRFIDILTDIDAVDVQRVYYENTETSQLLMGEEFHGAILIPERFEADLLQGRHPEINTYINNANLIPAGYISRSVYAAAGALNTSLAVEGLKKNKVPGSLAAGQYEAFKVNTFRLFNPASNYSVFVWPSFLGIIMQSVILVVLAISFASEFENHTFANLISLSSGSVFTVMFSKLIPYWILAVLLLGVYAVYFHLFRQTLPDKIGPVFLVFLVFVVTISFQGIIAGLLFKNQLQALQFLIILSMPAYVSSGFSWPFEQDGAAAKLYGGAFPYMSFVNGFRILFIEDGTLADIKDYIQMQFILLLIYGSISGILLKVNIMKIAPPAI